MEKIDHKVTVTENNDGLDLVMVDIIPW